MLIELINYEIKEKNIQYNFFKNGTEDSLIFEMDDREKYTDYNFALTLIKNVLEHNKKITKRMKNYYSSKADKFNLVDLKLIGYQKSKNIIEYTYALNNEKRSMSIVMRNKKKDYANEEIALKTIKRKISNSILDGAINKNANKKKTKKNKVEKKIYKSNKEPKKERKIYPTVLSENKVIILTKEPNLVETSDEELNCILREIMTIDELSKIELLKELIDDFANNLYLVRNDLNAEEKKGIAKIYTYYFNLHFKSKKTRDKVREFLENSESSNMIKIILNIY